MLVRLKLNHTEVLFGPASGAQKSKTPSLRQHDNRSKYLLNSTSVFRVRVVFSFPPIKPTAFCPNPPSQRHMTHDSEGTNYQHAQHDYTRSKATVHLTIRPVDRLQHPSRPIFSLKFLPQLVLPPLLRRPPPPSASQILPGLPPVAEPSHATTTCGTARYRNNRTLSVISVSRVVLEK